MMWGLAGRSLATFIFAATLLRLAGRKSLTRLNYFDYLMTNLMGGILGGYVAGQAKGAPILLAPALITTANIISEKAVVKSRLVRKYLQRKPLVIMQNGEILKNSMARARYNLGELLMALREKGIFDLSEVEFAVLEVDGSLGVQKKSQSRPATPHDLAMRTGYEGISAVLVSDGEIIDQNLAKNNLGRDWLYSELKRRGIKDLSEVFLASLAANSSLYIEIGRPSWKYK